MRTRRVQSSLLYCGRTNERLNGFRGGTDTGLEASRAPYSKSHARRLKRREKEQLTGRLWSLKAALPSIAPKSTTTTTATARTAAPAAVGEGSSADKEVDAAATTTSTTTVITAATAAGSGVSVKPITKSKQPSITSDPVEAPPPPPTRRPGQIGGEGHGAPLTKSQRRRALYVWPIIIVLRLQLRRSFFLSFFLFFFNFAPQESRAFPSTSDTFEPRVCCKSIRNYPNACPKYTGSAHAHNVNISCGG